MSKKSELAAMYYLAKVNKFYKLKSKSYPEGFKVTLRTIKYDLMHTVKLPFDNSTFHTPMKHPVNDYWTKHGTIMIKAKWPIIRNTHGL